MSRETWENSNTRRSAGGTRRPAIVTAAARQPPQQKQLDAGQLSINCCAAKRSRITRKRAVLMTDWT